MSWPWQGQEPQELLGAVKGDGFPDCQQYCLEVGNSLLLREQSRYEMGLDPCKPEEMAGVTQTLRHPCLLAFGALVIP